MLRRSFDIMVSVCSQHPVVSTLQAVEGDVLRNADSVPCFRGVNSSILFTYVLTLLAALTGGCSTTNVQQQTVLVEEIPYAQAMQEHRLHFLECERNSYGGGDVISEESHEEPVLCEQIDLIDESVVAEAENRCFSVFSADEIHEAELVGHVWFAVPEPKLIEDPLLHEYCIESAQSWCAPDVEDIYLSYIEHEKEQKFQAAIFPNFVSPVDNAMVLRGMQEPQKGRRGHYGLDLVPISWERCGTPIRSVEDGVVVLVSKASGYGYYTVVYHRNGLFSLYSHLLKSRPVKVGQVVERGEPIGQMGKSGNARGYHLHFELIDLREHWDLEEDVDVFVDAVSHGQPKKSEFNRFCKLLFSKTAKVDPLPGIPGLMAAKKVNGKWVAVPLDEAPGLTAQGK